MENVSLMKAKADKVIRDGKFSMVDDELDDLHNSILNQTSYKIYEEDRDSPNAQFQSIQNEIRVRGKNLQFKSAKFIASCFAKPEIHLKSKEIQTNISNPLEDKIKELELYNENLEDKLSAKLTEIENIRYYVSKLVKEKSLLNDEIKYLKDKDYSNLSKIEELEKNLQKKIKSMDELTIEMLNLKKEIFIKDK